MNRGVRNQAKDNDNVDDEETPACHSRGVCLRSCSRR
jgi:hypothetical protein